MVMKLPTKSLTDNEILFDDVFSLAIQLPMKFYLNLDGIFCRCFLILW